MTTEELWKAILGELELELSKATFKTFFSQTRLVSLNNGVATIACPNPLITATIESRYYALIKERLERFTNQNCSLLFTVSPQTKGVGTSSLPLFSPLPVQTNLQDLIRKAHLNPLNTFENFAVSGSNQMAYAASDAVAKNPGSAYNPLFLWGGTGVGKTHLMHAIGHAVLRKNSKSHIIYCMGEEFTNEIVVAIQNKTTQQFRQKYRNSELLLLDDVQFIAGKNAVQEEFFHTFNAIHRVGGQIVLTSDRPPHEIAKLEDRLRSRFEGGLTIDVSPPDFELRCAILRIKAKQRRIDLPMDITQLIGANITDTRKLEGTLVRLVSESQTKKLPISLELAQNILGQAPGNGEMKRLNTSPQNVIRAVAFYFNLKESAILGESRSKPIVYPRQILMYLLRTELGTQLVEIGTLLGGRDHTTVMHGVDKITNALGSDERLRQIIVEIKNRLSG